MGGGKPPPLARRKETPGETSQSRCTGRNAIVARAVPGARRSAVLTAVRNQPPDMSLARPMLAAACTAFPLGHSLSLQHGAVRPKANAGCSSQRPDSTERRLLRARGTAGEPRGASTVADDRVQRTIAEGTDHVQADRKQQGAGTLLALRSGRAGTAREHPAVAKRVSTLQPEK